MEYVACVFSTISLILLWFNLILPFLAKTHVEHVACVFSTISLILLWFNFDLILPFLAKIHVALVMPSCPLLIVLWFHSLIWFIQIVFHYIFLVYIESKSVTSVFFLQEGAIIEWSWRHFLAVLLFLHHISPKYLTLTFLVVMLAEHKHTSCVICM